MRLKRVVKFSDNPGLQCFQFVTVAARLLFLKGIILEKHVVVVKYFP